MAEKERRPPPPQGPQSFAVVLDDELREIGERRRRRSEPADAGSGGGVADQERTGGEPSSATTATSVGGDGAGNCQPGTVATTGPHEPDYRSAYDKELVGLSFSGGGIRSATFNLGILQGLADLKLLGHIDYLSTVSGGGYIGSWLTGLLQRESERHGDRQGLARVCTLLSTGGGRCLCASCRSRLCPTCRKLDRTELGQRLCANCRQQLCDSCREQLGSAAEPAKGAISWLRQYSNYLTPKVGVLTADTWAVVTTYLRNLLLNLVLLVSTFAAVLLLPRGWHGVTEGLSKLSAGSAGGMSAFLPLLLALLPAVVAVFAMGFHMASFRDQGDAGGQGDETTRQLGPGAVQRWIVLPLVLAAGFGAVWLYQAGGGLPIGIRWLAGTAFVGWLDRWAPGSTSTLAWVLGTGGAYLAAWLISWLRASLRSRSLQSDDAAAPVEPSRWWRMVVAAPLCGVVGGLLLSFYAHLLKGLALWGVLTWGPALIVVGFVLVGALQTGLAGSKLHDYQREWLSRVAAWLLIYSFGWVAIFGVAVYGTVLAYWLAGWVRAGVSAGWIATTVGGILASRGSGDGVSLPRALLAKVAPYAFIVGLLVHLAVGIDFTLSRMAEQHQGMPGASAATTSLAPGSGGAPLSEGAAGAAELIQPCLEGSGTEPPCTWEGFEAVSKQWAEGRKSSRDSASLLSDLVTAHHRLLETGQRWQDASALFVGLVLVLALMAWRVDVNEFSMHRLYRNRLVRCYLGASVESGQRDKLRQPFTGFYPEDDIPLADLGRRSHAGPYHIVNTALNLVGGDELAWQERKAASFVFTPRFCGFENSPSDHAYRGTYVCPIDDGDRSREGYGRQPKELYLGGAMAISGAAASPNMGFRSSAALAFLLTVFNVRLGWWLGNPKGKQWWRSGPRFSFLNLFAELLGMTQDDRRYVYLSDGGHFENLGIYELVRRRCRFIVACDAGADPKLKFNDLGNAVRKCRTDLGVEIRIRTRQIQRGEDGVSRWHCAVGTIDYGRDVGEGVLLYLKSSLTGDEPEDVLNYAKIHAAFPHESTGDQWFDESQFESYRRLGLHVAKEVLAEQVERATEDGQLSFERLVVRLRQRWLPPTPTVGHFSRHGSELEQVFRQLRESDELAFLDSQVYPEWHSLLHGEPSPEPPTWLPDGPEERRQGFYFCNSLIQLMENVYLDLNLEEEYDHPDNRGWMNLFKHWSWSGMFRATWAVSAATYGHRFQSFCQQRLGLDCLGCVEAVELAKPGAGAAQTLAATAQKAPELNFLEKQMVSAFLEKGPSAGAGGETAAEGAPGVEPDTGIDHLFALQVVVKNPFPSTSGGGDAGEQAMRFGCGFALARGDRLVCLRIQDHLRKMGLGRAALRCLVHDHDLTEKPVLAQVPDLCAEDFTAEGERKLLELFRSVERELDGEKKAGEPRDRAPRPA